jgi:RNA polymerase sigma-70 factor (ECF subfamily)
MDVPALGKDEDEAGLLARARAGDRVAFEGLVERHLSQVWGVVWRIVRHTQDAEDVVQDTFLTAWRSLGDFREEAALSTWLHRIAVTRALHHVERASERMRRASRSIDDEESGPAALIALEGGRSRAAAESPLRQLESKELLARLQRCLDKLPPAWRAVLALRDVDALAYDEIARVLEVALGTVRSRLARARMALKECVEGAAS